MYLKKFLQIATLGAVLAVGACSTQYGFVEETKRESAIYPVYIDSYELETKRLPWVVKAHLTGKYSAQANNRWERSYKNRWKKNAVINFRESLENRKIFETDPQRASHRAKLKIKLISADFSGEMPSIVNAHARVSLIKSDGSEIITEVISTVKNSSLMGETRLMESGAQSRVDLANVYAKHLEESKVLLPLSVAEGEINESSFADFLSEKLGGGYIKGFEALIATTKAAADFSGDMVNGMAQSMAQRRQSNNFSFTNSTRFAGSLNDHRYANQSGSSSCGSVPPRFGKFACPPGGCSAEMQAHNAKVPERDREWVRKYGHCVKDSKPCSGGNCSTVDAN